MFFVLRRNKKSLDFQSRWQKVEELLKVKRESALKQALMEADKLLGLALKEKRLKGETLGERLKEAKALFEPNFYQELWEAHKLRNRLVHEDDEILSFQIEKAVKVFKKALEKLKFLH